MAAVRTTGIEMMYQYVLCCSCSDACVWKIESTSKLGEGTMVFDLISSSCSTASGVICSSNDIS